MISNADRFASAPLSGASATASALTPLADEALLEAVQRQTFRFFWDGAHPASALTPDRRLRSARGADNPVAIGGSGLGLMALIVAVERGWVSRAEALDRLQSMLALLLRARCYHGAFPHFVDGRSGETIPFMRKDDGGDLVETSLLCMGLLCARAYFAADTPVEQRIRGQIGILWDGVEWNWYSRGGRDVLYWHWSPYNGWAIDHAIHGWNECLITYVLAAASKRYGIDPVVYQHGFASGPEYRNGGRFYDVDLPLGPPFGGPLFFAHYSFCGLDPRGLRDRHADYWEQNVRHVRINHAHCIANPNGYAGYGPGCWGLTSSDDPEGYARHAPDTDNGTISPTAALASFPYAPQAAMQALRHWLQTHGDRIWGEYGFIDAFCEQRGWWADTYLAIDQGPIIVMIENHRTGLLWRLFMQIPEVQQALRRLGFESPYLSARDES